MFSYRLRSIIKKLGTKYIHNSVKLSNSDNNTNPISRTLKIIGNDIKLGTKYNSDIPLDRFPRYCDVAVIGGGAMGSSIAYWLKERTRKGLNVVVIEKDPTVSIYIFLSIPKKIFYMVLV